MLIANSPKARSLVCGTALAVDDFLIRIVFAIFVFLVFLFLYD